MLDQRLFDNKDLTLKQFLPQLTRSRLLVSSILFGISMFLTVVWVVVAWTYNLDYFEVTNNFGGLERLFTGGTIRSLAIEGGQWWRIFTYGFAMTGYGLFINLLTALILGLSFWKILKFNEGVSGSIRTLIGFVSAYLLVGFTLSVLGGAFAYGGFFVITSIVIGMLIGTVNNHKNPVFDFMRLKLVWPIVLLIFLPLFTSVGDWIASGFGFVVGMAVMNLIHFRKHHSLITTAFSIGTLSLIFLLALIFVLVPLPYGLAKDYVVVQMLYVQSYYNFALTKSGAESILARLNWGVFEETFSLLRWINF